MESAVCVFVPNCILAEGCVWNRNEEALYFVDIEGCQVYRWRLGEEKADIVWTNQRVGCLVFHRDGGIVTAETSRLIYRNRQEKTVLLDQHLPDYLRYNDGKCDWFGNLWVGTMAISQSHPAAGKGGRLYCIKNGQVAAEYGGYTIPNGMAWNRDGSCILRQHGMRTEMARRYTGPGCRRAAQRFIAMKGRPESNKKCVANHLQEGWQTWGKAGISAAEIQPIPGGKICALGGK